MRRSVLAALAASLLFCIWVGAGRAAGAAEDEATRAYLADDLGRARKLLEAEIAAGGARTSRYLFLGRVYFRLEEWKKARDVLRSLLKKDPESPRGRELLGRVLFRTQDFKECLPFYEESLRESPRAELRLEYGEALARLGRGTDALAQLTAVTRDSRTWPRAHYLLGGLRLKSGLGHWAARQLWIAHRLGFKADDLSEKLARAFYLEGRITGPLFKVGPLKGAAAGDLGEKHMLVREARRSGEGFWLAAGPDCALYQVEAAAARAGGRLGPDLTLLAARCWLAAGNLERAKHRVSAASAETPEAVFVLAEIALAAGDLAAFEKLAGKWPPGERAAERLRRCLVRAALAAQVKADLVAALRLLERADRMEAGRSEVLRPMIDVLAQLGRTREAAGKARLLAELHPDSPEVRLIAGRYGVNFEEIKERGKPVLEKEGGREEGAER